MLFVKNMMFLDGATANLAPDLDILGEMAQIYAYFQQHYGEQIAIQLGLDPNERMDFDLDAVKSGFRLGPEYGDRLTYAQVKERRETIRKRMRDRD
jgi:ubiquinone biosynthesis protein